MGVIKGYIFWIWIISGLKDLIFLSSSLYIHKLRKRPNAVIILSLTVLIEELLRVKVST